MLARVGELLLRKRLLLRHLLLLKRQIEGLLLLHPGLQHLLNVVLLLLLEVLTLTYC